MDRDALAAGSGAAGIGPCKGGAEGIIPCPEVPSISAVLRRASGLGQRHVLTTDGDRLAGPAADRVCDLAGSGAGCRRSALAGVGAMGRGHRRPGRSAQAADTHPDHLRPSRRFVVDPGRGGECQRSGDRHDQRPQWIRPDCGLTCPPSLHQPVGVPGGSDQRGELERSGGQYRQGRRPSLGS